MTNLHDNFSAQVNKKMSLFENKTSVSEVRILELDQTVAAVELRIPSNTDQLISSIKDMQVIQQDLKVNTGARLA